MPRTTLTKSVSLGSYGTAAVTLTMTAAATTPFNQFVASGKDLVVAHNTDSGAHNITITSVADKFNRTQHLTSSIAAGAYQVYGPYEYHGWKQTDGNVYLEADSTTVKFGIVEL